MILRSTDSNSYFCSHTNTIPFCVQVAAGHLQLAEIELRTGSCTDKCCGVVCASTGVCVDGKCACQDGYSGVDCGTLDPVWSGPFTNRGASQTLILY